ncbi:MAG: hypothetical protein FWD61_01905 [Phycisphaerales bacterium]|nr:hypothetical protein [Phycisphaerales bacterium]
MPYAELLMKPMLSPEDGKAFDEGYADAITKSLAGTPDLRKKTAELLESSAASVTSAELKRYLMLNAFALSIRSSISAKEREAKALALLPLLTERTLPVMQARADALNDLQDRAASSPSNTFYDLYLTSHVRLTKARVQTGYPKEALDSLKKARDAARSYTKKPQVRTDELNEAAAWCDRANQATTLAPKYQEMLKANPTDSVANAMMATLHLSLYGNLEKAAIFAANSDRPDMKQLTAALKSNPPRTLSKDPARHAEQVLLIGQALIEVAKATSSSQMFDRYSIACFAGDRVAQVLDDGAMPQAKILEAKMLLASAKEIIDKSAIKRGEDLPKWLGGGDNGVPAAASKTITCLADVFRDLPKELQPTTIGWTPGQFQQINDWFAKNLVKQSFNASVYADRLDSPRDGPDGKAYVPFICRFKYTQLANSLFVLTYIEVQASPAMAARAIKLNHEAMIRMSGTITSVDLAPWSSSSSGPTEVRLTIGLVPNEGN